MAGRFTWNLCSAPAEKSITAPADIVGRVKGIQLVAINTGGSPSLLGILCTIKYAPNRLHRIAVGETKCREKARPKNMQEGAIVLARKVQIGRMLVKTEQKLSQGRSIVAQNVAYAAARKATNNSERKAIIRGWGEGDGASSLNRQKSDGILKEAARKEGIRKEDIATQPGPKAGGKKEAGSIIDGRQKRQQETVTAGAKRPHQLGKTPQEPNTPET